MKKKIFSSSWPWTDLISIYKKYVKLKNKTDLLELGPGHGANIPFFLNEKYINYHAIEYNKNAVSFLKKTFKNKKINIKLGDFSKNLFFKKKFKIIIDRGSITNNKISKIIKIKDNIDRYLNKGGLLISIDLYSTKIKQKDKKKLKKKFGDITFFDKSQIKKIFTNYKFIYFDEKKKTNILNKEIFSSFSFVIKKK